MMHRVCPLLGIRYVTIPDECNGIWDPLVYVANHQTNWDIMVLTGAGTTRCGRGGKKSLVWLPLFGLLFYLSGNILIDRNRSRAIDTIRQVVDKIRDRSLVDLDVPGRHPFSRGRGLLPFKTGAFHTAMQAGSTHCADGGDPATLPRSI